jgi:CheY-like chemotaxis protein
MLLIGRTHDAGIAPPRPQHGHGRRVLIVEDDAASRVVTGFLCRRAGMQTVAAATLGEGLALLSWRPDCVLLDLMLPDGNGVELLRHVRARDVPVRVAVATAAYDWHLLEEVKSLRPDHVFLKPVDWRAVTEWLRGA